MNRWTGCSLDMPFLNENGLNVNSDDNDVRVFAGGAALRRWTAAAATVTTRAKAGRTARYRRRIGDVRSGMCELVTRTTTRVSYSDNNNSRQVPGTALPRRLDESASSVLRCDHHKPWLGEPNVRRTHSGWQAVAGQRAEADGLRLPVSRSIRPIRVGVRMLRRVRIHPALASPALLTCRPRPT